MGAETIVELVKNTFLTIQTKPYEGPPIAVEDDDDVKDLREALAAASKELDDLKAEEQKLQMIVDPPPESASAGHRSVSSDQFYDATARWSEVRALAQRAKGRVERLSKDLAKARETAQRELDDQRWALRQPLIKAVFEPFLKAVEATETLIKFDEETRAMGGSYVSLPCPGLVRGIYEFQLGRAKKDGLL